MVFYSAFIARSQTDMREIAVPFQAGRTETGSKNMCALVFVPIKMQIISCAYTRNICGFSA